METLLMREPLPDRRYSWSQKVRIGGQTVYLCVGEYADGRPGELFIDVAKQGTFLRGVMGALARTCSIALQCGADVSVIVHALKGASYPPEGMVEGSKAVQMASSVTDWISRELAAHYEVAIEDVEPADAIFDLSESFEGIDECETNAA